MYQGFIDFPLESFEHRLPEADQESTNIGAVCDVNISLVIQHAVVIGAQCCCAKSTHEKPSKYRYSSQSDRRSVVDDPDIH